MDENGVDLRDCKVVGKGMARRIEGIDTAQAVRVWKTWRRRTDGRGITVEAQKQGDRLCVSVKSCVKDKDLESVQSELLNEKA